MISSKALCVLFLLYISIDKSQNLENISSSKKSKTRFDNVEDNVEIIVKAIMPKIGKPNSESIGM